MPLHPTGTSFRLSFCRFGLRKLFGERTWGGVQGINWVIETKESRQIFPSNRRPMRRLPTRIWGLELRLGPRLKSSRTTRSRYLGHQLPCPHIYRLGSFQEPTFRVDLLVANRSTARRADRLNSPICYQRCTCESPWSYDAVPCPFKASIISLKAHTSSSLESAIVALAARSRVAS